MISQIKAREIRRCKEMLVYDNLKPDEMIAIQRYVNSLENKKKKRR